MKKEDFNLWEMKMMAWTHDPVEKCLVLYQIPGGHETGTVARIRERLFGEEALPSDLLERVKEADHWAAAADRPQFPREKGSGRFAAWANVRFESDPVIIHPLTGSRLDMHYFEIDINKITAVSFNRLANLVYSNGKEVDFKGTFLKFWRCAPHETLPDLGLLAGFLPADTRVPTHSIWEHLNLTSAIGALTGADPEAMPALLKVSIGPVQSFIAQARTTSDLWAGSHLLSRIVWEALEVLVEEVGPDSVIYPDLRGAPLVDAWLARKDIGFEFPHAGYVSDRNPIFTAALPNTFVALVPSRRAEELMKMIDGRIREWTLEKARQAARRLLEQATGKSDDIPGVMEKQLEEQLAGFPEVHWAIVPWSLVAGSSGARTRELSSVLGLYYPLSEEKPGFLSSRAWGVLSKQIDLEDITFYKPNPGVLYPALYDLLDRSFAASKSVRTFERGVPQQGYRCTLCGEREWLTRDRRNLDPRHGKREDTLWLRVQAERPGWARKGEHLCAVCTLKRLWPNLFCEEVEDVIEDRPHRFVVSTHTMALAPTLEDIVNRVSSGKIESSQPIDRLLEEIGRLDEKRAALPARLYRRLKGADHEGGRLTRLITGIPLLLDRIEDEEGVERDDKRRIYERYIRDLSGHPIEKYYALLLMDGDDMGAWISGKDERFLLRFRDSWHPWTCEGALELAASQPRLGEYLNSKQPASPSRHAAISRAINGFALGIARLVVEEIHAGKLLYAGGDDVMAMVSVRDLLSVMKALRYAYSGLSWESPDDSPFRLKCRNGFVLCEGNGARRLMVVMGHKATLSMGAVIAHYTAPLGAVVRELRKAERRAKGHRSVDGRAKDAFSISLMKRSGGTSAFTSKWFMEERNDPGEKVEGTVDVLEDLRDAFREFLSRRAAYGACEWLDRLAGDCDPGQLQAIVGREMVRHAGEGRDVSMVAGIVARLVDAACRAGSGDGEKNRKIEFLKGAIRLVEFLSREGRS